jgi:glycosyltransferase involved in cell wall biosynthesis
MKLLAIGHPFFLAHNQKKYVAMKKAGVDIRLLVPDRGRDRFEVAMCETHPSLTQDEVIALKAWAPRSHMTYFHNPVRIAALLREFEPDLIHIEEEPQAVITLETLALRDKYAPQARVTLFTWDNLIRRRRFPLGAVKNRLRNYSLRRVAGVICGNRRSAELLRAEGKFAGPIEVIPQYGLDPVEHQPGIEAEMRTALGLQESIVVGYVGRLVPEKGLRILIEALDDLNSESWKLLLVGDGSLEEEIRQTCIPKFQGRILLLPPVPYEQVPRLLRCMDVFVLPSYSTPWWMEQFGLGLAQAMMVGLAPVGSSSGAIPEVLGLGGVVFKEGDSTALATILAGLFHSSLARKQSGERARAFALRNYTLERVTAQYVDFFQQVFSGFPINRSETQVLSECTVGSEN